MFRAIVALILAVTICPFWMAADVFAADEKALYDKAQSILDGYRGEKKDLVEAQDILNLILKANPNSAPAFTGLGRLAYKAGYQGGDRYSPEGTKLAEELLAKAVLLDPNYYDAWYYRSYARMYGKQMHAARAFAEKAREIDPDTPRTSMLFASLMFREEKLNDALLMANRVLGETKDQYLIVNAHYLMADIYIKKQVFHLAEGSYLRIVDLESKSPWALSNYSLFLSTHKRDYDRALEYAQKALDIMDFPVGRRAMGQALYGKGVESFRKPETREQALEYFSKSLTFDPTYPEAHYGLGIVLYSLGAQKNDADLLNKAIMALDEAVRRRPGFEQAKLQRDAIKQRLKSMKKAGRGG